MNTTFSRPAVVMIVAAVLLILALSAILPSCDTSPESYGRKSDPSSYSNSAIGHSGFYDVLRRLGRPVGRSTGEALAQIGPRGLLIIAEPQAGGLAGGEGQRLLTAAPRLLLVLPKWGGQPAELRPGRVSDLHLHSEKISGQALTRLDQWGTVIRRDWPRQWTINEIGSMPSGPLADVLSRPSDQKGFDGSSQKLERLRKLNTIQLMRSEKLRPVVALGDEMLVGELRTEKKIIWVLSDPDLLSNQGLVRGDNALFMVALVDRLRNWRNEDERAPIIFEESLHGFYNQDKSPTTLIFRFPFVVVTVLACLAAFLAVLAGIGRFGAPLKPQPSLDFGKAGLIGNGARLLDHAGYQSVVLRRYCWMTAVSVARGLHAPAGLNDRALTEWLDKIGRSRGLSRSCADILGQVPGPHEDQAGEGHLNQLFQCAQDIYHWRLEMEGRASGPDQIGRKGSLPQ